MTEIAPIYLYKRLTDAEMKRLCKYVDEVIDPTKAYSVANNRYYSDLVSKQIAFLEKESALAKIYNPVVPIPRERIEQAMD